MLLKLCKQYASKFGNLPVATGLKRPVFIPIPKRSIGEVFKLPYNSTHFTCQPGNAQNPSSQASKVHEPSTSRCISWIYNKRRIRDQIANICWITEEKYGNSRKTPTSAPLTTLKFLTVWITTNWVILKKMGIPDHLTRLLRNVCRSTSNSQNWTWKNDWFKIGKGVCQHCILSPGLFNFYVVYIM